MGRKSNTKSRILGCGIFDKSKLDAETIQMLLKNATATLSQEGGAAAHQATWVEGIPDGLSDEYQRYLTLLRQKQAVLERVMSLGRTHLYRSEVQMLERECTQLHNECLDASVHMRDSYANVPDSCKRQLNYLVNFDRFLLSEWLRIERE
jgi:hypothetical protein